MSKPSEISENLKTVHENIHTAALQAGRAPQDIDLVAVSKTHPAETIALALEAGHRLFGENKVQEAEDKWPDLRSRFSDVRVHLIGPLQSNKTKRAVQLFDVIETLDRPKLARALAREMKDQGRCPDLYIQINTGEEPQKAGVLPGQAEEFIALCVNELKLPVIGLMCIPPAHENPGPHFAFLAEMAKRNQLRGLSMGMSGDYAEAVRFGATSVRVGTAIFGARGTTSLSAD